MDIIIIHVWNPKGGQGKSTLALSLCGAAASQGQRPLLICQDQQGTSVLYGAEGNLPFPVAGSIPDSAPDADIVVIDHQASDWSFPANAQLVIIPVKPQRDQYASYLDASALAQQHIEPRHIIPVVMDSHYHRGQERQITKAMRSEGAGVVSASGAIGRASTEYRTIFDPALDRIYGIKSLRAQVEAVLAQAIETWQTI